MKAFAPSIRTRLARLILLASLPGFAVPAALIWSDYLQARDRTYQNALGIATNVAAQFDEKLAKNEAVIRALSTSPALDDGDLASFYDQAQAIVKGSVLQHVILANPEGPRVINTMAPLGTPIPGQMDKQRILALQSSDAAVVSPLIDGKISHRLLFSISVPVVRNNVRRYHLTASLEASTLQPLLEKAGIGSGWPLATMAMAGEALKCPGLPEERQVALGTNVDRSVTMMRGLIDDLLGFARVQLGSHIPIKPAPGDLRQICETALEDARAAYPNCSFRMQAEGDLAGAFDRLRLHQLFTNLLLNAAQYRSENSPVALWAQGDDDTLTVRVQNHGAVVPKKSLELIFAPLTRLAKEGQSDAGPRTNLGLGLFVAREIASAHGGTITVKSNETDRTEFTVCLPRTPPAQQA